MIFSSLQNKLSDVKKTYINISNGQKFELYMKVCFILWIGITVKLVDSEPLDSKQKAIYSEPLSYNQFAYLLHRPTVKYLVNNLAIEKETSSKGFSACDVGNWIFSKSKKFFEKFFGNFLDFFGNFLGIFLEDFFEELLWEEFCARILKSAKLFEYGRNFGRNFMGGIF